MLPNCEGAFEKCKIGRYLAVAKASQGMLMETISLLRALTQANSTVVNSACH